MPAEFDTVSMLAGEPALNELRVRLFKAPALADWNSKELADIVEVNTPGYEASPSEAWEEPSVIEANLVVRESQDLEFVATGSNPGCNALGYYVTCFDGERQILVDIVEWATPRPFATAGARIVLRVTLACFKDGYFPTA